MNAKALESFIQLLYIRGMVEREQILLEAVRVVRTYQRLHNRQEPISGTPEDKERLFAEMQSVSESSELGHFPGDREFFYNLYAFACELDLIELLVKSGRNDRNGMLAPTYLVKYLAGEITKDTARVLLAEAEKFAEGLQKLIAENPKVEFTLTTEKKVHYLLLVTAFSQSHNVRILNQSIYRELINKDSYDLLITIPSFGSRYNPEEPNKNFITRDSECIAVENLIRQLGKLGKLIAVLPAKVTFASGPVQEFRQWIMADYHLEAIYSLPEGIFRPYAGIKTYLMVFDAKTTAGVIVGKIIDDDGRLVVKQKQWISDEEFNEHEDWRTEIYLADDNEVIQKFKSSGLKKIKLKDVAEIFRGKSVLKDDLQPGKIRVLNISNMDDGELVFDDMDTINEEVRKVKRYQLEKDDILLTCRGTSNKVAVFPETEHVVIASANIIVLRIKEKIAPQYMKIFLDSPIGQMMIKSFQRGTTMMNINPNDIGEMEIPLLSMERQQILARQFLSGQERYRREKAALEQRWEKERTELYKNFVGGC
ncbi:MAG: restriction endonuclease subunit S [Negativicutes bacterium]